MARRIRIAACLFGGATLLLINGLWRLGGGRPQPGPPDRSGLSGGARDTDRTATDRPDRARLRFLGYLN